MAATADLDGDGWSDLAVSAPRGPNFAADLAGKLYLFPCTIQGTVTGQAAMLVLHGEHIGDLRGSSVAGGFDADGDCLFGLAIGAPNYDRSSHGEDYGSGMVYLFTDLRP